MRIECPHCGAAGEIDETKRPAGAVSIRCPRCRESIPFDVAGAEKTPSEPPGPAPVSVPETPGPGTAPRDEVPGTPADTAVLSGMPGSVTLASDDAPVKGVCSLCFESFPREDMLRFDSYLVCASCKPVYEQMLQEGVPMPGGLVYSGFWRRFGAKFIDNIILGAIDFFVSLALLIPVGLGGALFEGKEPATASPFLGVSAVIAITFYYLLKIGVPVAFQTFFLGRYGATPGKMALGIRVVSPDGGAISYKKALGRSLAEFLSAIILGIGYLLMLFDKQKRTLHDMICDTRVVLK